MKFTNFYYKNFNWKVVGDDLEASFLFTVDDKFSFTPKITYKNVGEEKINKNRDFLDNLIFNIGLVESLSYWKAFLTQKISVQCGFLDDYQINWWNDLLVNGMGQFFYENKINFTEKNFSFETSDKGNKDGVKIATVNSETLLIPVGGGKDSIVTLDILSKVKNVSAFLINPSKASLKATKVAGVNSITVERKLDPKLLELNSQGFFNGHTPFTALLSFTSILGAVLRGNKEVVFSNEASSDEENTVYLSRKINHQYSKTFEFENKFREYNSRYLSGVNYFSFLRPLYDLQIAKIFSRLSKYHSLFRSCNVGQTEGIWCGKCPKCLSTYILLHPFMKEKTQEIFGKDLLSDESLKPLLNSLINENEIKPFECVGTRLELNAALGNVDINSVLGSWNNDNNLEEEFVNILKENL